MYCPNCNVNYQGWSKSCPVCKQGLENYQGNVAAEVPESRIAYSELVDMVRAVPVGLSVEVNTVRHKKEDRYTFPYFGYRYSWVQEMQGASDVLTVQLRTNEVARDKATRFPYMGFGFAWEAGMEGWVDGNLIQLEAVDVKREMKWSFPYQGHGYAWTEKFTGTCGDQLTVRLEMTDIHRSRKFGFPYRGYASAYPKKGILTLETR